MAFGVSVVEKEKKIQDSIREARSRFRHVDKSAADYQPLAGLQRKDFNIRIMSDFARAIDKLIALYRVEMSDMWDYANSTIDGCLGAAQFEVDLLNSQIRETAK